MSQRLPPAPEIGGGVKLERTFMFALHAPSCFDFADTALRCIVALVDACLISSHRVASYLIWGSGGPLDARLEGDGGGHEEAPGDRLADALQPVQPCR